MPACGYCLIPGYTLVAEAFHAPKVLFIFEAEAGKET